MDFFTQEAGRIGSEIKLDTKTADGASIFRLTTEDGEGKMTSYEVFPGIWLIYNDFHTSHCFGGRYTAADLMEINHCRQGRFECDFDNGSCAYLEEGDLSVHRMDHCTKNACFPLEHYQGVSVVISLPQAGRSISCVLGDISIDLYQLRDRLCPDRQCFIMRATDSIEHIFCELYRVPDEIKLGYFKLKVLELLLFLSVVDTADLPRAHRYFQKDHIAIVKAIKAYMTQHPDCHFTLEELSSRFGIPLTSMKLCFKGVYGTPIYAYMRSYRMQSAAALLRSTRQSISTIAAQVGYINVSKFSCAFKQVMGESPLTYRRKNCLLGAIPDQPE